MKLYWSLFICVLISLNAAGQNKCNCLATIDKNFSGWVKIYDEPNGKVVDSVLNDNQNSFFLILTITDIQGAYFNVNIKQMSAIEKKQGWIKQDGTIGVYARNYSGDNMHLYKIPEIKKNKIESTVSKWIPELYVIRDCDGEWEKVELKYLDEYYSGWMAKDMQCADTYKGCY